MPAVALLVFCWRQSLDAVYLGVSFGYVVVCTVLASVLIRLDWTALANEAQQRANGGTLPSVDTADEPSCSSSQQPEGQDDTESQPVAPRSE